MFGVPKDIADPIADPTEEKWWETTGCHAEMTLLRHTGSKRQFNYCAQREISYLKQTIASKIGVAV